MGEEVEVKYLIKEGSSLFATDTFRSLYGSVHGLENDVLTNGDHIKQGYLDLPTGIFVARGLGLSYDFNPTEARLRYREGKFYFTLKGEGGTSRPEEEVGIEESVFNCYWNSTLGRRIEKFRLVKSYEPIPELNVEFDVFIDGRDLVLGEIRSPFVGNIKIIKTIR